MQHQTEDSLAAEIHVKLQQEIQVFTSCGQIMFHTQHQTFTGTNRILGDKMGVILHKTLALFSSKESVYICHTSNHKSVTYATPWFK